ncbi:MAG: hypothetical protein EYC70_00925 [Planctomycetota bacterium]|nr:MAG: hypothetical protein EYC70_00925 [Planctomycetota bacterium]
MRFSRSLGRVLVPALLSFAAGGLLGYLAGSRGSRAPAPLLDPDLAAYHAGVVAALQLDATQAEEALVWLWKYQQERSKLIQAHSAGLEPSLANLDQRYEQMLRTRILRPEQWPLAQQLAQARKLSAAPPGG